MRRDKIAEETEDNSIQIKLSSVVKVTPEFQKYIAKHLDIAIENSLLEVSSLRNQNLFNLSYQIGDCKGLIHLSLKRG